MIEINKKLLSMGWTVIRFWGNEIKKNTDECIRVIEETILILSLVRLLRIRRKAIRSDFIFE